jgi:hypothetical protein
MAKDVPGDGNRAGAIKRAGQRKTVNAANLQTLGAPALADLLLEIGGDYPAIKRRLRLELAGEVGAADLAAEIGKRIDTVAQSGARINWRRYKDFVRELDLSRRAIAGKLAELDPALALPLMIRLIDLHAGVFDRVNDAKGEIGAVFDQAVDDAGAIAPLAKLADPRALSDQLFELVAHGRTAVTSALLGAVTPALSAGGVASLRHHVETAMARAPRTHSGLRAAAQILADVEGDVDGYIAYFTPSQLVLPPIGAKAAKRLLQAGRIDEAAAVLDRSAPRARAGAPIVFNAPDSGEWDEVHIAVLEAEGDAAAAQAARWAVFEAGLSPQRLRDYLRRLADFDDVVAEDRAMDLAAGHPNAHAALAFLLDWPAFARAAALVVERQDDLKAQDADLLTRAARALEGRSPLAATILLRKMILHIARNALAEDYRRAQTLMLEAASLAPAIEDEEIEGHAMFARQVASFGRW